MAEIELETVAIACRINTKKGRKNARQIAPFEVSSRRSAKTQSDETLDTIISKHAGVAAGVIGAGVVRRGEGSVF